MNGNYFNSYMKARIFCEREVPSQSSTEFVGAIDYQYNIISTLYAMVVLLVQYFVHEIATLCPSHPSAADEAWYWPKCILHSG